MNRSRRELVFDLLVLFAAAIAHTSIMLGIGVDLLPTLAIGAVLIAVGVVWVVPAESRVPAAVTGLLGMVVAGAVVPIYAARAVRPGSTLPLSLLLAGLVLMVTFGLLRVTAFARIRPHP